MLSEAHRDPILTFRGVCQCLESLESSDPEPALYFLVRILLGPGIVVRFIKSWSLAVVCQRYPPQVADRTVAPTQHGTNSLPYKLHTTITPATVTTYALQTRGCWTALLTCFSKSRKDILMTTLRKYPPHSRCSMLLGLVIGPLMKLLFCGSRIWAHTTLIGKPFTSDNCCGLGALPPTLVRFPCYFCRCLWQFWYAIAGGIVLSSWSAGIDHWRNTFGPTGNNYESDRLKGGRCTTLKFGST